MKKRILIIQNVILHYRKPLYNLLAKGYNLTVIHSGEKSAGDKDIFNEIIVPVKKIGTIRIQKGILEEVKQQYDVVIAMSDLHWLNNILLLYFRPKNVKFIWWGSWFTNKFFADRIKVMLAKKADANIYYCEEAKKDFHASEVPEEKLFVANNTFDVGKRITAYLNPVKNRILFVGTLNERKENDILLKAFHNILSKIESGINLTIIGEGLNRDKLLKLTNELNIQNRVIFAGKITEPKILLNYYAESIVSVSYGQAGLSVLQSLGFGVPFITKKGAISGGEINNIIDGYNGYLCNSSTKDLSNKLLELCKNQEKARKMGKNAFDYYSDFCTIDFMADGFKRAIES